MGERKERDTEREDSLVIKQVKWEHVEVFEEKHVTDHLARKGYHVPAVRRRDIYYSKLEDERARAMGQI